ncbi:hypothetical protein [Schumannella soli]|uniref:Uncharacterized protein n=1 Tax=Schumannella soli TaxID=2590779 RepID=A0A506XY49_9MICO|nr:hypothetical protein [Schumannella soli]TPW77681.1 hypothetical protein FJ657_03215 [Schumannella soli]
MTWQLGAHPDDVTRTDGQDEGDRAAESAAAVDGERRVGVQHPGGERPINRMVGRVVIRPRADTRQADLLALLPILPVLLSMGGPAFSMGWSPLSVVQLAIPVAVVQGLIARRDRRIMSDRGFVDLPSSLLALLSPILYLGLRARACSGHDESARSIVRWAIGVTVVAVLLVAIGSGFQAAMSPLFTGAEQE